MAQQVHEALQEQRHLDHPLIEVQVAALGLPVRIEVRAAVHAVPNRIEVLLRDLVAIDPLAAEVPAQEVVEVTEVLEVVQEVQVVVPEVPVVHPGHLQVQVEAAVVGEEDNKSDKINIAI